MTNNELEKLAAREEALALKNGGHHGPLARMIRTAISRSRRPRRRQLDLFTTTRER